MMEYASMLTFLLFSVMLSSIIPAASYVLGVKNSDNEKASVFECGFDPFGDSRQQFEVSFFLVAILFMMFDLEISFLFPWSVVLDTVNTFGYWTMYMFLFILTMGLVYEWNKGGLEWE